MSHDNEVNKLIVEGWQEYDSYIGQKITVLRRITDGTPEFKTIYDSGQVFDGIAVPNK